MSTESELVFERYLEGQRFAWSRFPTSAGKTPDYRVQHGDSVCLFEVKEFDNPTPIPNGGFSPLPAIREKIGQARKQFRAHRQHSCSLLLWNSRSIFRNVMPYVVASAAFGQCLRWEKHLSPNPAGATRFQFFGPAELTSEQNTTISAIIILSTYRLNHLWLDVWRELEAKAQRGEEIAESDQFDLLQQRSPEGQATYSYEGTVRGIVLENPYARIPLPADLFRGPFDQRWRFESNWFRVASIGSELERLRQDGVPFIFL